MCSVHILVLRPEWWIKTRKWLCPPGAGHLLGKIGTIQVITTIGRITELKHRATEVYSNEENV